jgi:hypothetical protein
MELLEAFFIFRFIMELSFVFHLYVYFLWYNKNTVDLDPHKSTNYIIILKLETKINKKDLLNIYHTDSFGQ